MTPHIPWWQRRFYVHPIQRKYFFLSLVPLVVCAFLLILLVFLPLHLALRGPTPDPEKAATLGQIYPLAVRIWWRALFISMLASGLLSFFVTNKFAGPLHRIEQIMQRIGEGDLPPPIRVRQRDDLQEFARLLDGAFGTITSALTAMKEQAALAATALAALQEKVNAGLNDAGEIRQGLEGISRRHGEMEQILAQFRLPIRRGDPGREDRGGLAPSEALPRLS